MPEVAEKLNMPAGWKELVKMLQHGLDGNPFMMSEFVAHHSSPQFGSLNHRELTGHNAPGQAGLDAYGVEADIRQPTVSAEAVENEPIRTYRNRKST